MNSKWPIVKLGNHCEKIGSGATPRGGSNVYLNNGKICLIRSQNVYNDGFRPDGIVYITDDDAKKLDNVEVKENDVLINITGDSVARVCLAKVQYLPARVNQHVTIIRSIYSSFDNRFIRYFLVSPEMQDFLLSIAGAGGTRNAITKGMLESLDVPKPELKIQNKISDILQSFENKIDLNIQINQTLEEIARAIFKSWFVDFDPVKAKMAAKANGQDPQRAAMLAISGKTEEGFEHLTVEQKKTLAETAALFPDAMQDSELGKIPQGWEVSFIGKEVEMRGGGTPSTKKSEFWKDGKYHWTTPKDLSGIAEKIIYNTSRKITELGLQQISNGLLPINTVLMSSRAPVGYLAIAKTPISINQGYIAMVCNKELTPEYILHWANSNMDEIKLRAGGTTFAEISKKNFRDIPVILPEPQLLKKNRFYWNLCE